MAKCEALATGLLVACLTTGPRLAHANGTPSGVIVVAPGVNGETMLRQATDLGGVEWRLEAVIPEPASRPERPSTELEAMERALPDVELERCLAAARSDALRVDRLLFEEMRDIAARVLSTAAACAYQADFVDVARAQLALAVTRELALRGLPAFDNADPALLELYEELERDALARGTIRVSFVTDPPGGQVWVDGRRLRCDSDGCVGDLRPGYHTILARELGFRERRFEVELREPEARRLALDPAPANETAEQLADARARDVPVDTPAFVVGAAQAYSASVVMVADQTSQETRVALFEVVGGNATEIARASADDPDGLTAATAAVIDAWLGRNRSLTEEPLFWVGMGLGFALVAAVGVTLGVLLQPDQQFDLVGL